MGWPTKASTSDQAVNGTSLEDVFRREIKQKHGP